MAIQTPSQLFLLRLSATSGDLILLVATIVFFGWILNIPALRSFGANFVAMNPISAGLFALCGIAIKCAAAQNSHVSKKDPVVLTCGILVTLGGLFEMSGYYTEFRLDLTQWVFGSGTSDAPVPADEFAPSTAVNFLICGVGLLLLDVETRRGFRPAQALFLAAALLATIALVGYAYCVLPLSTIGAAIPMALSSACAFALTAFGALGARPDRGLMAAITSESTGGVMARRLLPAAVLIPLISGALLYLGEKSGYIRTEYSVSLFTVANLVLFTALIWWNARLLFSAERERSEAERRLAVQYGATRALAGADSVASAASEMLKEICGTLGWQVGAFWRVDHKINALKCEAVYSASAEFRAFADITRGTLLAPGIGLPGRVWLSRRPTWIEDVLQDKNCPRAPQALQTGIHGAFGLPVVFDKTTCGVLEFFSSKVEPRDEPLLQILEGIGCQVGQFLERKEAEQQLKQASIELARSNAELQQFAYLASHDLSEPLRMIASYLELLRSRSKDQLDAESQEFIGYAVDGAQRMQGLIEGLLAYARVESKGRAFETVDCEQVLAIAIANLKVAIDEARATITHGPLPKVKADGLQLTQVFQNLIGNGIKFRSKASPSIDVRARRNDAEWVFSVQDNGIGIDPKDFERVFVLFQRLHTRKEYAGSGMGLAICKKIVERHGGRIWVESKPGEGATFFFTLPARN